ncbi:MAG TPA: hypothetical protein VM841_11825 [Actinomycetota bacterium]|nr:hypothetical protein [Actinomycetota bacterium]
MRVRITKAVLTAALAAMAIIGTTPAGAVSAYHMNGQGTITMQGAGLPSCLPVVLQGDCTHSDQTFSWGTLTVQGAGILQDAAVAGQYRCKSEGDVGGTAFVSKIRGNTSNFELTFNFQCQNLSGVGPTFINGWFSNINGSAAAPYRSVAGHPHPTPVEKGVFTFKGYFTKTNTHPYNINNGNGDAMTCVGGFAPSGFNGLKITTAAFAGACTAAE